MAGAVASLALARLLVVAPLAAWHTGLVMRNAWDLHAGEWISWARAPGHDSYWRFHRDAFLPLVPPPGRLTLDIGCGEGRLTRDLSRLGHRVLGIDASPVMVRAAASVPGAAGRVAAGDAAALPVADAAADCAVAFMSLQDVDHMEQAVAGAARVLVPGGRLVIAVTHPASTAGKFAPGPDEAARPFVIDGSWFERRALAGTCERDGYTMTFHSWHRPLQACTDALADTGFLIERIREVGDPSPADKWHSHAVPPPPRPALVRRNISSDAHMGMPGLTSTQVPAPAESGTR